MSVTDGLNAWKVENRLQLGRWFHLLSTAAHTCLHAYGLYLFIQFFINNLMLVVRYGGWLKSVNRQWLHVLFNCLSLKKMATEFDAPITCILLSYATLLSFYILDFHTEKPCSVYFCFKGTPQVKLMYYKKNIFLPCLCELNVQLF